MAKRTFRIVNSWLTSNRIRNPNARTSTQPRPDNNSSDGKAHVPKKRKKARTRVQSRDAALAFTHLAQLAIARGNLTVEALQELSSLAGGLSGTGTAPTYEPETILSEEQAAAVLHIAPKTLMNWRSAGKHDLPFRQPLGKGSKVTYKMADLTVFMESRSLRD